MVVSDETLLAELHYQLIHSMLQRNACPTNTELAEQMGITPEQVEQSLNDLAEIHGVVLHPHVCAPWVIHPFSVTPTINWIEGPRTNCWAPCVWCALGVAALTPSEVRIHTRHGAEGEPIVIRVVDGQPADSENLWVHFAIPPARAWDNVHQHCSMVLPFHSKDSIAAWCERHKLPQGEPVPLAQVAELAQHWYGRHADRHWRKWSVTEAQEIFHRAGLRSPFWDLGAKKGKF